MGKLTKKEIVILVVILLVVCAVIFAMVKYTNDRADDWTPPQGVEGLLPDRYAHLTEPLSDEEKEEVKLPPYEREGNTFGINRSTLTADMLAIDWIDTDVTIESLEKEAKYISKEVTEDKTEIRYYMDGYEYHFYNGEFWGDEMHGVLSGILITETSSENCGPLGIKIGDSKKDLIDKYPDTYANRSMPEAYGNYVWHVVDDGEVTAIKFIPMEIVPFAAISFDQNVVSEIYLYHYLM